MSEATLHGLLLGKIKDPCPSRSTSPTALGSVGPVGAFSSFSSLFSACDVIMWVTDDRRRRPVADLLRCPLILHSASVGKYTLATKPPSDSSGLAAVSEALLLIASKIKAEFQLHGAHGASSIATESAVVRLARRDGRDEQERVVAAHHAHLDREVREPHLAPAHEHQARHRPACRSTRAFSRGRRAAHGGARRTTGRERPSKRPALPVVRQSRWPGQRTRAPTAPVTMSGLPRGVLQQHAHEDRTQRSNRLHGIADQQNNEGPKQR
jgi:hypothetical protein